MARPADPIVGRTVAGKFLVEGLIGSGAMGAVYRARHMALGKTIAIKVLHGEHAGEPKFVARFQREAKAASRLNHPNSMQVIDFGAEPDGLLYIAMEYLDGRSLHRVLREERPMPAQRIADILMQTLAALAVAHDMGVVHRDLKPENIVVLRGTDDDGRPRDIVKVCDFGIAKLTDSRAYRGQGERDSTAPVTSAGFLVGTPEYVSPEQGRGEALDLRTDLYSAGVVLYEMLTGQVPFEAENAIGVVLKHITEEPRLPSQIDPAVDRRLEAICVRALRKTLSERYQTAREMRADLRAVVEVPALQPSEPELASTLRAPDRAAGSRTLEESGPRQGSRTLEESGPRQERGSRTLEESGPRRGSRTLEESGPRQEPGYAATVDMPGVAPHIARAADEGAIKPTLVGTTAAVVSGPRRVTAVAAAALLTGVLATGATLGILARFGPRARHVTPATMGAPSVVALTPIATLDPAEGVPPLEEGPPPQANEGHAPPRGARAVAAAATMAAKGGQGPARSKSSDPNESAPTGGAPGAAPAPVAAVAQGPERERASSPAHAAPAVELAPTATIVPPPAAGTPAEPDPDFDPNRGYVELGLVNAQGVRESAVRSGLRGVGLAACYRSALKARGARGPGVATLDVSIDENGVTRSAIVSGANFLPGLARCVQGAAAGLSIPKSQVDSGGGTAEVTIAFKSP
jgi:serine/threonine protein kinase